jgi:hypothetical protein
MIKAKKNPYTAFDGDNVKGGRGVRRRREIVSAGKVNGSLIEWKGNYGWVQPFYPVNHPDAADRDGRLYLAQDDIDDELGPPGSIVNFVVYFDGTGLGAMNCESGRAAGGAYAMGRTGKAMRNAVPSLAAKKTWTPPEPKSKTISVEDLASKVHGELTEALWAPVKAAHHLEENWSPEEMLKRVVRYLYKNSVTEDLTKYDWNRGVRQFVEKATWSYVRACEEKQWFTELKVGTAVGLASCRIAEACGGNVKPPEVKKFALEYHKACLQKSKIDKFLWEAIQVSFPLEEKYQTKLYNALSKSYSGAFDAAYAGNKKGAQRAEQFVESWMSDGLSRAWGGLPEPEATLNVATLTQFISGLLSPPSDPDAVSCVPAPFMVSRSAEQWAKFLEPMFDRLFQKWQDDEENPQPSKKRKKGKNKGEEEFDDDGDDE